jgi:hypothetical protein
MNEIISYLCYLGGVFHSQFAPFRATISSIAPNTGANDTLVGKDDKLIWPYNSDGNFSIKSCCTLIDSISYANDRVFEANVWIKGAPPKIQVFFWLAVQDKLSARAFLHH